MAVSVRAIVSTGRNDIFFLSDEATPHLPHLMIMKDPTNPSMFIFIPRTYEDDQTDKALNLNLDDACVIYPEIVPFRKTLERLTETRKFRDVTKT
jgi:hypothetical protein